MNHIGEHNQISIISDLQYEMLLEKIKRKEKVGKWTALFSMGTEVLITTKPVTKFEGYETSSYKFPMHLIKTETDAEKIMNINKSIWEKQSNLERDQIVNCPDTLTDFDLEQLRLVIRRAYSQFIDVGYYDSNSNGTNAFGPAFKTSQKYPNVVLSALRWHDSDQLINFVVIDESLKTQEIRESATLAHKCRNLDYAGLQIQYITTPGPNVKRYELRGGAAPLPTPLSKEFVNNNNNNNNNNNLTLYLKRKISNVLSTEAEVA